MPKQLPTIVIDSREQKPYVFKGNKGAEHPTVTKALPAGDYSIEGYETEIAVERKSLDDFVGTVIHQRDRFHRELVKLRGFARTIIVVEGTTEDVLEHAYISQASPKSVLGRAIGIHQENGIPVMFWGNRQIANYMVQQWLIAAWAHQKERECSVTD